MKSGRKVNELPVGDFYFEAYFNKEFSVLRVQFFHIYGCVFPMVLLFVGDSLRSVKMDNKDGIAEI